LETLIAWLGFLFSWQDILATKNALVEMVDDGLDAMAAAAPRVAARFDAWIADVLANQLDSPALAARLQSSTAVTIDAWAAKDTGLPAQQADPRLQWATTRLPHLAASDAATTGGTQDPTGPIGALLAELNALMGDVAVEYQQVAGKASDWLADRITTADFAVALLEAVGALALDVVQRVVDGFLAAAATFIATAKQLLSAQLDVPFLSTLYRTYVSDAPLSVLDATCLVLAVPMTVGAKIACGKAPFSDPSGAVLKNTPATFFGSFAQTPQADDPAALGAKPAGGPAPYALIGAARLLRAGTVPMLTAAAINPATPGGTSGVLVADQTFRALSAWGALAAGAVTPLKTWAAVAFSSFWVTTSIMYGQQCATGFPSAWAAATPASLAPTLGDKFNALGLLDSACVTSVGVWGAVLTAEGWGAKIDAVRAAEVLIETFQAPAILGFFANAIARKAPSPLTTGAAVGLASLRVVGMFGSGISAFGVAGAAA
jgi:hypothetical protein